MIIIFIFDYRLNLIDSQQEIFFSTIFTEFKMEKAEDQPRPLIKMVYLNWLLSKTLAV